MHDSPKIELTRLTPPPGVPDKHDILPIHTSDRALFKRCRRKWDWSSPIRENLAPKLSLGNVNLNLWFGTGIHWALRQYYDTGLRRDPVETFIWWYDLTWRGGIILDEQYLDLSYDRSPEHTSFKMNENSEEIVTGWKVRGLEDLLADPDKEEFEEHRELGIKMMEFYREYSRTFDNFSVIQPEHTFSIPLGIRAVDPRDGLEKDVHYRGTQDAIIQDNDSGRYGILEHKTAIRIDDNYFRKLEKDEQCTSYMWAAEREAEIHDLEYDQIDFVIYNAVRKAYPRPPTMTSRGIFSVDRQKESTTIEMLEQCIEENGLQVIVESDEKLQGYVDYVREAGYEQFLIRKPVTRNRAEIESCGDRILMEVYDMLGSAEGFGAILGVEGLTRIYPNPTGDYSCLNCEFRAPCIARDDGSDWQDMLSDLYEKKS